MTRLWCLHGNLQKASVWRFLDNQLANTELELVDLWQSDATGFWGWAEQFCETVEASKATRHVLLGYSLGGRLALHALLKQPELWHAAVIVAADSGLSSAAERTKRLAWDQAWAERFLKDDWQTLLNDWDAQAVFAHYPSETARTESDFSRQAIATLFNVFSKGRQDDLLPQLKTLRKPKLLYLSGEDDKKYTAVGTELAQICPALSHSIIPKAGHRLPWENQEAFIATLKTFLAEI